MVKKGWGVGGGGGGGNEGTPNMRRRKPRMFKHTTTVHFRWN